MDDVFWLTDDEQASWRSFVTGARRLLDRLDADLKAEGLAHDDYAVLVALSEAEGDRMRMSELADTVVESRSRLSHHVARMEQRGLVVRTRCPEDRRGSWAELTPAGRTAIEDAAPHHVEGVRRWFFDHAEAGDLDTVRALFDRIDTALRADRGTCADQVLTDEDRG